MMKRWSKETWLPASMFAAAAALAALLNVPLRAVQGRPPGGVTCAVSARVVQMAGNAVGWTLNLTSTRIETTNNKKAVLEGKAGTSVAVDMSGVDTNGNPFNFPGMRTSADFSPVIKAGYDPGTRVGQFAPMECKRAVIEASAKETAKALLDQDGRKARRWNLPVIPAQNVELQVNGTFKCLKEEPGVGIANALTVTLAVNAAGTAPQTSNP